MEKVLKKMEQGDSSSGGVKKTFRYLIWNIINSLRDYSDFLIFTLY